MASIAVFAMYAFASSTSGAGTAGEAIAPIQGWSIYNLDYQFSDDPTIVESVTFDLNAPANRVTVSLNSASTATAVCDNSSGYHWQCIFHAGVSVSSMDEIRVIAVDN